MPTTKKPITVAQAIDSAGTAVGTGLGKVGDGGKSIGNGLDSIGKAADSVVKGVDSFGKNLKDISTGVVVVIGIAMLSYMIPNCYKATLNYTQNQELQEQNTLYQDCRRDYRQLHREINNLKRAAYHTLEGKIQDSEK